MNDSAPSGPLTTNRKALQINLDPKLYGTLAEIGAGQEVARYFFRAGGASGTVAKSMSAYDMKFSDEIYGKAPRYVSRERLQRMMEYEYELLETRLSGDRGADTSFFAFANTVATQSFTGKHESHGWLGMRFQDAPGQPPSDVIMHVRMLDHLAIQQQAALGISGVNMIYAAFFYSRDINRFMESLRDNLEERRLEIDILECRGPVFKEVDLRRIGVKLVEMGFTNAVMFGPGETVLQPASALRKRPILLERGGYRPFTHVNADMITHTRAQFSATYGYDPDSVLVLAEITLKNLQRSAGDGDGIDCGDLMHRVNILNALGLTVLVSNYFEYYRLSAYFRRYTDEEIAIVLGISNLLDIFNPNYYEHLDGGILEAFGRLFKNNVHLYIYPALRDSLIAYIRMRHGQQDPDPAADDSFLHQRGSRDSPLVTAANVRVRDNLRNLYKYLLENQSLVGVDAHDPSHMTLFPSQVLKMIQAGEPGWETHVPSPAAEYIRKHRAFGVPF